MRRKNDELYGRIIEYVNGYFEQTGHSPSTREIEQGVGVPRPTVQRYLKSLQERGEIEYDGHRGIVTEYMREVRNSTRMQMGNTIPCGPLDEVADAELEYIRMPTALTGNGDFFLLRAKGESMINAGIDNGDLVLIRPLQYHFIQIDSPMDYERYDILFDEKRHGVESAGLIPGSVEIISLADNAIARDIFRKADYYHEVCDAETFEKLLSHLLCELFYNLSLSCTSFAEDVPTVSPLLEKALTYINDHLCTLHDVSEIAENLFISESYLFRLFKAELHQTPKKYITDKRLLMAQKMLEEGERPAHVYEKCGFCDYTAFYRSYKAFFGHPPSMQN